MTYEIKPLENASSGILTILLNDEKAKAINAIEYDHIPTQRWFPDAEL